MPCSLLLLIIPRQGEDKPSPLLCHAEASQADSSIVGAMACPRPGSSPRLSRPGSSPRLSRPGSSPRLSRPGSSPRLSRPDGLLKLVRVGDGLSSPCCLHHTHLHFPFHSPAESVGGEESRIVTNQIKNSINACRRLASMHLPRLRLVTAYC